MQLVAPSKVGPETLEFMASVPVESTVLVEGTVSERPTNQKRPVSHFRYSTLRSYAYLEVGLILHLRFDAASRRRH